MRIKRGLLCSSMALCLTAVLCACGGSQPTPAPTPDGGKAGVAVGTDTPYLFETGGTVITVNKNMADVLADLGEPQSYFEAASCAFDGLDKTYTYTGFVITTRPEGDTDMVNSILLTDDSVTTPEGLYIGCLASDVTAVYGECNATEGVLSCVKGDSELNFVLEGDKVISIEYLPV